MFNRKPKIPIDIALPNKNLHDREPILETTQENHTELGEVTVLHDVERRKTAERINHKNTLS
jgi:hypothetical protein